MSPAVLGGVPADGELNETAPPVETPVGSAEPTASQILETLLADAVRRDAGNLPLEPEEHEIRIRCRIEGELVPILALLCGFLAGVVTRAKLVCGRDIAETQRSQDGHCRIHVDGRLVERRASSLPGGRGAIVVFRVLTPDSRRQRRRRSPCRRTPFRSFVADSPSRTRCSSSATDRSVAVDAFREAAGERVSIEEVVRWSAGAEEAEKA